MLKKLFLAMQVKKIYKLKVQYVGITPVYRCVMFIYFHDC